jgi:cell division septation protein DedD
LHLVWIGPFTEKGSAENLQEQIAAKYRIKSTIKPMD